MIKITRWSPDTCECVLEYQWDDSQNEDIRVHTIANVVFSCPAHSSETNKDNHYSKVLDENQRKNKFYGEIIKNVATAVEDKIQPNGDIVKDLKKGKEYKWSFDASRNLVVDLVGFDTAEKAILKNIADSVFSTKVKIK